MPAIDDFTDVSGTEEGPATFPTDAPPLQGGANALQGWASANPTENDFTRIFPSGDSAYGLLNPSAALTAGATGSNAGSAGPSQPGIVTAVLPGVGGTYLDPRFAPKVQAFMDNARNNGVDLQFDSAYRSPEAQTDIRKSHGYAYPPAQKSLHSAGLAVDVQYGGLPTAQQQVIRDAAAEAGLSWGGRFNDPGHFYLDPGGDRQAAIDDFTARIRDIEARR